MNRSSPSVIVDSLVVSVHRAVMPRHGDALRAIVERWNLSAPGIVVDLAEFVLADALTPEVAVWRYPFLPDGVVAESIGAMPSTGVLRTDLPAFLDARAEVAASMWGVHGDLVETAIAGATTALAAAARPLAIAARSLPEPDDRCLRLHHLLTGLRYERLGAHVEACDAAGLRRSDAVVLTKAWSGERLDDRPTQLTDLGLLDADRSLTAAGRRVRDRIEAATEAGCEPMWAAVPDRAGWVSVLAELADV